MLICVNNQTIEWPPKTSNSEKLVTLISITEATGGLSNPIRKGTLTQALRFYPNQFHTSAMKKICHHTLLDRCLKLYITLWNIWTYQQLYKKITQLVYNFTQLVYNFTQVVYFFYTTVGRFICFTVLCKLFKQWSNSVNLPANHKAQPGSNPVGLLSWWW